MRNKLFIYTYLHTHIIVCEIYNEHNTIQIHMTIILNIYTYIYICVWERIRPVIYRSIFMLRTKVRHYLARLFRTLVRGINILRYLTGLILSHKTVDDGRHNRLAEAWLFLAGVLPCGYLTVPRLDVAPQHRPLGGFAVVTVRTGDLDGLVRTD